MASACPWHRSVCGQNVPKSRATTENKGIAGFFETFVYPRDSGLQMSRNCQAPADCSLARQTAGVVRARKHDVPTPSRNRNETVLQATRTGQTGVAEPSPSAP